MTRDADEQAAERMLLRMIVIYDHPLDHPAHWVVRAWDVPPDAGLKAQPQPLALAFESLDVARRYIRNAYPGAVLLQPARTDPDPVVFEVYA